MFGVYDSKTGTTTAYETMFDAYQNSKDGDCIFINKDNSCEKTHKPEYSKINLLILMLNDIPKHSEKYIIMRHKLRKRMTDALRWENKYLKGY